MFKKIGIAVVILLFAATVINRFSATPTFDYRADQCTRYCHNQGCRHFLKKAKTGSWLSDRAYNLYRLNIQALRNNWFGVSYQQMNIILYVIVCPLVFILLGYTAFKK